MPQNIDREKRILLVDDEEPLRRILKRALETDGHTVVAASNGEEGFELFIIGQFDLVITDLMMPGLKGDELAIRIKRRSALLPVILMTATPRNTPGGDASFEKLLIKPFSIDDLREAIAGLT